MPATDKDTKRILKEAKKQGFEVRQSGKGYPMVYKRGRFISKCAQTPSDPRGMANFIATLRRAGFRWPPKR